MLSVLIPDILGISAVYSGAISPAGGFTLGLLYTLGHLFDYFVGFDFILGLAAIVGLMGNRRAQGRSRRKRPREPGDHDIFLCMD
eukprot:3965079-Heterocapsa_arctica.AAC.1